MVKNKKTKASLQQISDVAWLVRQGKNKMGILNKDVQNHFFYINGSKGIALDNEEEVLSISAPAVRSTPSGHAARKASSEAAT